MYSNAWQYLQLPKHKQTALSLSDRTQAEFWIDLTIYCCLDFLVTCPEELYMAPYLHQLLVGIGVYTRSANIHTSSPFFQQLKSYSIYHHPQHHLTSGPTKERILSLFPFFPLQPRTKPRKAPVRKCLITQTWFNLYSE
jgi:hypothetical protein